MAKEVKEIKNTTFYIGIRDYMMSPVNLGPILVGDTIIFDHYGTVEFTLIGDVESPTLKYGQSWQFKCEKAKDYKVSVKEYPNMECTISVVKKLPLDHYRMMY